MKRAVAGLGRAVAIILFATGLTLVSGLDLNFGHFDRGYGGALAQEVLTPQPSASTAPSSAQSSGQPGPPSQAQAQRATPTSDGPIWYTTKHPWEIYLSATTVILLVLMALLLTVIAWKSGFTIEFQRTFLLLTVIFAALFLIVAGYSDDQTAPVFSLLGAIVGYLFGRTPAEPTPPSREQSPAKSEPTLSASRTENPLWNNGTLAEQPNETTPSKSPAANQTTVARGDFPQ